MSADGSTLDAVLSLAQDDLDRLLAQMTRSAARRRRLDRRDGLIRELAAGFYGQSWGLAGAIVTDLDRFRTGTYRGSGSSDTPKQQLMRGALDANGGRVPGDRQVQNILAGKRTPPLK